MSESVTMSKREEILETAKEYVTRDRNKQYGDPEDNFAEIAALWSTYTGYAFKSDDVAVMMILLKIARIKNDPRTKDNWVDIAGYAACGYEAVKNE